MQVEFKLGRSERLFRCSIWDVVILPAFGASVQEMQLLKDKGCTIVDTTCPWFPKSGIRSEQKGDYTSIIHGTITKKQLLSSFAGIW